MSGTDFIKIRAALILNPNIHVTSIGIDGKLKFSPEFMEKLYEYEEEFRSLLIIPINEAVGLHNWAIKFVQHPTEKPTYFADIYSQSNQDYLIIVDIITNLIKNFDLSYYHKGNVSEFLSI